MTDLCQVLAQEVRFAASFLSGGCPGLETVLCLDASSYVLCRNSTTPDYATALHSDCCAQCDPRQRRGLSTLSKPQYCMQVNMEASSRLQMQGLP